MANRSGSPYSVPRDANHVPFLVAASTTDGITPVVLEADPATHLLQVSSGGSSGGGTQYTDGSATITHPIGTIPVYDKSGTITAVSVANPLPVSASVTPAPNLISTVNSSTTTLSANGVFTGTSEDVSAYADIRIAVFSDVASATDGLSMQQSTNGTNWDQVDTYTVPAGTGKAFDVPVYARYFRIVYTNGATIQATFRLQSVYHITRTKPSSQRPQDSRPNDNDMEENLAYGMVYDSGTNTWSRAASGNGTTGLGTQRVTLSSDSTGQVKLATGANVIGSISNTSFAATQSTAAALTAGWPTINGEAADVTGTFTNATQTTSVTANNLDGYGNTLISINGTYGTATAIFEGSDDGGTTWYTVQAARDNTNVIETGYTSLTNTNQTWQINNPGFDSLRVRSTAVASGTVNIRLSSSAAPVASGTIIGLGTAIPAGANVIGALTANQSVNNAQVSGTAISVNNGTTDAGTTRVTLSSDSTGQVKLAAGSAAIGSLTAGSAVIGHVITDSGSTTAVTGTVAVSLATNTPTIAAGTNAIGTVNLSPTASGGWTPYFANAITTTVTPTSAAGKFGGYMLINLNSAPAYLQVFDTTGAVTLGSTAPTFVIPIPANATAANGLAANVELANGIVIANGIKCAATTTSNGATTVTTGLTGTLWVK